VEWVRDFYSVTGRWWGRAESPIGQIDRDRVATLHAICGETPKRILELGCGYGSTVAAMTEAGHHVTGVEISDRADFSEQFVEQLGRASRIVKDDFYTVQLDGRFDVVCYWNGFGIGSDRDQRVLLRRVAADWLTDGGTSLIDIANPFVWARWDGDQDHRPARPEDAYEYDLSERTNFDVSGLRDFPGPTASTVLPWISVSMCRLVETFPEIVPSSVCSSGSVMSSG
jgi:SAM-dependent methyltransferase